MLGCTQYVEGSRQLLARTGRIALTGSCYFDKPVPFGGSTFTALLPIDP